MFEGLIIGILLAITARLLFRRKPPERDKATEVLLLEELEASHAQLRTALEERIKTEEELLSVRIRLTNALEELQLAIDGRAFDQQIANEAVNARLKLAAVLEEQLKCSGHSAAEIEQIMNSIENA